jgi:hypothetical protein
LLPAEAGDAGRLEFDAAAWYRALTYDFLYTAPSHLRLAQIYERWDYLRLGAPDAVPG